MGQMVRRGVPAVLMQDMWWFDRGAGDAHASDDGLARHRGPRAGALLIALIGLADFLFIDHPPGVSLAIFALALGGAVWILLDRRRELAAPGLLLVLSTLPVVEYVQALSLGFLLSGFVVALCWAVQGSPRNISGAARRFAVLLPVLGLWQARQTLRGVKGLQGKGARLWQSWAFTVAGVLVFSALILSANPVLSDGLNRILRVGIRVERLVFWLGMALLLWPVLAVAMEADLLRPRARKKRARRAFGLGINAQSVANALVTFNLLMLVQTGLDAIYLWGGGALPDGMSYAQYAHRGAYPLVVTALLAGAFALAARPYLEERPGLRLLVTLWLAQNVLLVISSMFRLSLYVDVYGLTYLRVHAAIWMALVAVGLCLTGWQILRRRPNGWLLTCAAGLGIGVLYACCFVNFAALIADYNLRHDVPRDGGYLCHLGPMAARPLLASTEYLPCHVTPPVIGDWREWGFRADRVIRSLSVEAQAEMVHENTRGR